MNKEAASKFFWRALFPLLLLIVFFPYRVNGSINPHDEGVWLGVTQALIEGRVLYRDVWVQYGPLFFIPGKILFEFIPPTIASARGLAWAMNAAGLLVIYACVILFLRSNVLRVIAAIFVFLIPAASHAPCIPMSARYGVAFLPLLFWFWSTRDGNNRNLRAFICGLATAFTFFSAQEFFAAAFISSFIVLRNRFYLAGVAALGAAGLIFMQFYSGLAPYFQCVFLDIAKLVHAERIPFPTLQTNPIALQNLADVASVYLPPLTYLAALFVGIISLTQNKQQAVPVIALAVMGILMLGPAWGRSDRWHIYICIAPWVLTAAATVQLLETRSVQQGQTGLLVFLVMGSILFLPHYINASARERAVRRFRTTAEFPRAGNMKLPAGQANAYATIDDWIQTNTKPGDPVLIYPYNGAFYFIVNRPNPTRYPILAYAVHEDQQHQVVEQLRASQTEWVVWDTENTTFDGKPVAEFLGAISTYIHENYTVTDTIGPIHFLKKRPPL